MATSGTAYRLVGDRARPEPAGTLARRLHPSAVRGARLSPLDLLALAQACAAGVPPSTERAAATERRYELLEAADDFEVWVIHWPSGGQLDLHDHGGSAGALWVRSGTLLEGGLVNGRVRSRRLISGQGISFGPSHVHDVVNRGPGPATSVHAYSPPLASMTFYRSERGRLAADRTDYRAGLAWTP
jgi:hypothetical protein